MKDSGTGGGMEWVVLDSRYIIKRPWLTARVDKVKLPSGVIMPEYYILEYPAWVNVIAVTEDGLFVIVRQYRHGLRETRFELCAGVCEDGERPLESAQRELLEETGYAGGDWKLLTVLSANSSTMTNLTYCYIANGVQKVSDQNLEDTEDIEVHLLSEEQVLGLLVEDEIKQSLMAAPLWKYFATKSCQFD